MNPLVIGDLVAPVPVIQGGMGVGISLSGLAGAVAANGGIGVLSAAQIGFREESFVRDPLSANLLALGKEIDKARKIARGGVLGINIMTATKHYAQYVQVAVKAGIDLIISGAGLPVSLPEYVKGSRTKIAPIVSTAKSARVICRMWDRKYGIAPDLVIIEGPKAGGHLGFTKEQLFTFTEETYEQEIKEIQKVIRDYTEKYQKKIPIVLAGGIYDQEDVKKAFHLGMDGVQMGTRFVTTRECDASDAYKQAYLCCKKEEIRIVNSPVGMPARAIINTFTEKTKTPGIHGKCLQCLENCNPATTPYCITRALVSAVEGDMENALVFCGENAWRSEKIESVADIMREVQYRGPL